MAWIDIDKEIKFVALANTQIKFYNQTLPANIFERIENFLSILSIHIVDKHYSPDGAPSTRNEIYFDDAWILANQRCSLSIRSHSGRDIDGPGTDILILRLNESRENPAGVEFLKRREFRAYLKPGAKDAYIASGISLDDVKQSFPSIKINVSEKVVFQNQGDVRIRRSWFACAVASELYYIYIDKFYFANAQKTKYSEHYTEIDIERRFDSDESYARSGDFSPTIIQFARIIRTAFDINQDSNSKYQRFKDFCISDGFENYYFIGFDVASYSAEPSWIQKVIVQRFHRIIKEEILRSGFYAQNEPVRISIGDGAIIAVNMDWPTIVGLLNRIGTSVTRYNKTYPHRQIDYRTAIHYGPVYRFTDLNSMINLTGQGINTVSRILDEADVGQVVLSQETVKRIVDGTSVDKGDFSDIGSRPTKHGNILWLYEYKPK